MSAWTHVMCEHCWFTGPGRISDDEVRIPSRISGAEIDTCHWCGEPTVAGILTRHDPKDSTLMCQSWEHA